MAVNFLGESRVVFAGTVCVANMAPVSSLPLGRARIKIDVARKALEEALVLSLIAFRFTRVHKGQALKAKMVATPTFLYITFCCFSIFSHCFLLVCLPLYNCFLLFRVLHGHIEAV